MPKSASASAILRTAESKKDSSPLAPLMKWTTLTALSPGAADDGAMDKSAIIKMANNFRVTLFGWGFLLLYGFGCWLRA